MPTSAAVSQREVPRCQCSVHTCRQQIEFSCVQLNSSVRLSAPPSSCCGATTACCVSCMQGPRCPLATRILFHCAHARRDEDALMALHSSLSNSLEDQLSLAALHFNRGNYQVCRRGLVVPSSNAPHAGCLPAYTSSRSKMFCHTGGLGPARLDFGGCGMPQRDASTRDGCNSIVWQLHKHRALCRKRSSWSKQGVSIIGHQQAVAPATWNGVHSNKAVAATVDQHTRARCIMPPALLSVMRMHTSAGSRRHLLCSAFRACACMQMSAGSRRHLLCCAFRACSCMQLSAGSHRHLPCSAFRACACTSECRKQQTHTRHCCWSTGSCWRSICMWRCAMRSWTTMMSAQKSCR